MSTLHGAHEAILISALNHFTFCPRRAALIHVEQIFEENVHTARGDRAHARVDQVQHEVHGAVRVERALPIWSDRLGLTGRADEVEFGPGDRVYPVEYKKGKLEAWENDDIQLAAQAMCLEEMLGVAVPRGAIFHVSSRRRREVNVDGPLRARVEEVTGAVQLLLRERRTPAPIPHPRCEGCSLKQRCLPELPDRNTSWLFKPLEDSP